MSPPNNNIYIAKARMDRKAVGLMLFFEQLGQRVENAMH